jgi:hypothetical protein
MGMVVLTSEGGSWWVDMVTLLAVDFEDAEEDLLEVKRGVK